MKKLKFISHFVLWLWVFNGLLTIGSIYLSRIGFFINLFVGLLFVLIGIFFYNKEKYLLKSFKIICLEEKNKFCEKNLIMEFIFLLFLCLVGIAIFSGIFSRIFFEGFAVFG